MFVSLLQGVVIALATVPTPLSDASIGKAMNSQVTVVVIAPDVMIDCNLNGYDDIEDIVQGRSLDANRNSVPDECEDPIPVEFSTGEIPACGIGADACLVVSLAEELLILHETGLFQDPATQGEALEFLWQDGLMTAIATVTFETGPDGSICLQGAVRTFDWLGVATGLVVVTAALQAHG